MESRDRKRERPSYGFLTSPLDEYTGPDTFTAQPVRPPPVLRPIFSLLQNAESFSGAARDWVCVTNCACRCPMLQLPASSSQLLLLLLLLLLPAAPLWHLQTLAQQHHPLQSGRRNFGASTHTTSPAYITFMPRLSFIFGASCQSPTPNLHLFREFLGKLNS